MAQTRTAMRARLRVRALMRRFGIGTRLAVAVGLLGVMIACAVAGLVVRGTQTSFLMVRAHEGEGVETRDAPAGAEEGSASDEVDDAVDASTDEPAPPREVVVHVDGAVNAPGVYRLVGDDLRLSDAVDQAGGLAPGADTSTINLAAPLEDGTKIHVPAEGEAAGVASEASLAPGAWDVGAGGTAGLININTATQDELTALSGVGEATARAIVEDRERNGPFEVPEDLMRVTGIGEKKFERVRDDICV